MLYAPPPYVRHYYYYWFWGRAGPGGFVCLEEHRPGLGRDDGDEADMTPRRYFSQIISSVRLMSWTT